MPDKPYIAINAAELENLRRAAARWSEPDLRHPLSAGWTVSAVLAHLAFWDLRALNLIDLWERDGVKPSPVDVDVVNEATRPICLALEPTAAVKLALESAAAIDARIAGLSPEFLAQIESAGKPVKLDRAHHRRVHLDEIEQTLG